MVVVVEIAYVDACGVERRDGAERSTGVLFEEAAPYRSFPSFKGQRNYPGLWWSATSGRHVGFESWLERDTAMLMDFDPLIIAFSSQPFQLFWRDDEGKRHRHVPTGSRVWRTARGLSWTFGRTGGSVRAMRTPSR